MPRKVSSIFALLGLVVSQMATLPHAHAGLSPGQERELNARPHIHVGREPPAHSHDHLHSQGHDGPSQAQISANGRLGRVRIYSSTNEHDTDAIYLSSGSTAWTHRVSVAAELSKPTSNDFVSLLSEVRSSFLSRHPPNRDTHSGKLFLKLRTLRI